MSPNIHFVVVYCSNLKLGVQYIYVCSNGISFNVCVYNFWEFYFINLRIANNFVDFGNYAPVVSYWQHKHKSLELIVYKNLF